MVALSISVCPTSRRLFHEIQPPIWDPSYTKVNSLRRVAFDVLHRQCTCQFRDKAVYIIPLSDSDLASIGTINDKTQNKLLELLPKLVYPRLPGPFVSRGYRTALNQAYQEAVCVKKITEPSSLVEKRQEYIALRRQLNPLWNELAAPLENGKTTWGIIQDLLPKVTHFPSLQALLLHWHRTEYLLQKEIKASKQLVQEQAELLRLAPEESLLGDSLEKRQRQLQELHLQFDQLKNAQALLPKHKENLLPFLENDLPEYRELLLHNSSTFEEIEETLTLHIRWLEGDIEHSELLLEHYATYQTNQDNIQKTLQKLEPFIWVVSQLDRLNRELDQHCPHASKELKKFVNTHLRLMAMRREILEIKRNFLKCISTKSIGEKGKPAASP